LFLSAHSLPQLEEISCFFIYEALSGSFCHKGAQAALRATIDMNVMKWLRMVTDCPRKQIFQVQGQIFILSGCCLMLVNHIDEAADSSSAFQA